MGRKPEGGCGVVLAAEFGGAPAVADDAPAHSFERVSGGKCCRCGEEVEGKQAIPTYSGETSLEGGLRNRKKVGKAR
ncbi:hypothetical protein MRX96_001314 [Rhipicephalus microplus]